MKRILIIILSAVITEVSAQQEPQFSQNMFTILPVNPGYAGIKDAICGSLHYRTQWAGFIGAPKTMMLNVDAPVKILRGGVGATFFSDRLGVDETIGARLNYSYHLSVGPGLLGIGAQAGFIGKTLRGSELEPYVTDDGTIPTQNKSDMAPAFAFGLYYNTEIFYLGVSATQLAEAEVEFDNASLLLKRHYYITAGYNQRITPAIELVPSVWIKSEARGVQLDANLMIRYNNQFWGGVSYRITDAIVAMIGTQWNDIKFGYSYDVTTSSIRGYSNGTHEIMLGYCFKLPETKSAERYRNVRFL